MSNISVIIRNKNESEHIGLAIQSVLDHLGLETEIIIIDNNSIDDSLRVVALFDRLNIKTFKLEDPYTPGKSLNYGVSKASYDNVLILSAHSQITDMDIEYVEEKLRDNVAVFGKQTPIYRGKKITPRYVWSHFGNEEKENLYSKIEDRYFLHNAFCFYKKDTLQSYPFDEKLSGKEDRYWAIDRVKDNMNYLYTPKVKVNHYWTSNGATWKGLG